MEQARRAGAPAARPSRRPFVPARRRQRGATAVELALVLPVLVIVLFGIVQFSISYNQKQGLHAAAREGARHASLPSSTASDVRARVGSALAGVALSGTPAIVITPDVAQPCRDRDGEAVSVEVTSTERISIPLVLDRAVTLTGRGVFRCE